METITESKTKFQRVMIVLFLALFLQTSEKLLNDSALIFLEKILMVDLVKRVEVKTKSQRAEPKRNLRKNINLLQKLH